MQFRTSKAFRKVLHPIVSDFFLQDQKEGNQKLTFLDYAQQLPRVPTQHSVCIYSSLWGNNHFPQVQV